MQTFTGFEYLLIDAANQFGLDKELFEDRLEWAKANLDNLEALEEEADELPLYRKCVMEIRKAQAGKPSGHAVGFDACCSGIQVMSALTGCEYGAEATGFVNPNKRSDAYAETTERMGMILGNNMSIPRKAVKSAVMTSFYGSTETPKALFGEDTPELDAFYQAVAQIAPGAFKLLGELRDSWQPFTPMHRWVLPDGYVARVKVMEIVENRIKVEELDSASFTYQYSENNGSERGLSNIANVVHSVDAYVLRCLIRRCNYDVEHVTNAVEALADEQLRRECGGEPVVLSKASAETQKYIERFASTNMVDVVIAPYLDADEVKAMSRDHIDRLRVMLEEMLEHKPFEVISVHDEFKCHANHMNVLRQQYINIFAEMAESTILEDVFAELYGVDRSVVTYERPQNNLSQKIRGSNYALS